MRFLSEEEVVARYGSTKEYWRQVIQASIALTERRGREEARMKVCLTCWYYHAHVLPVITGGAAGKLFNVHHLKDGYLKSWALDWQRQYVTHLKKEHKDSLLSKGGFIGKI